MLHADTFDRLLEWSQWSRSDGVRLGFPAQAGYAEYRTHLSYMDDVAETFDFNDHALRRLNETLKDALDPNGIVAPGKSGIWPRRYRGGRR